MKKSAYGSSEQNERTTHGGKAIVQETKRNREKEEAVSFHELKVKAIIATSSLKKSQNSNH